jgi:hypothetical protein
VEILFDGLNVAQQFSGFGVQCDDRGGVKIVAGMQSDKKIWRHISSGNP